MEEYIKEIEQIAAKHTESQSDGYSQIMRICDAMREEQRFVTNNWIHVNLGLFPEDMEDVQVTFIGYNDHIPHCEGFAYRNDGDWYWSLDDSKVKVEITAWRRNREPYKAD